MCDNIIAKTADFIQQMKTKRRNKSNNAASEDSRMSMDSESRGNSTEFNAYY